MIGNLNVKGYIFAPKLLNTLVEIEVELAIHNLPDSRVAVELAALGRTKGAEVSILRRILLRIVFKCLEIVFARELVGGFIVGSRVFRAANRRLALSEIRDYIVTVNRKAKTLLRQSARNIGF